MKLRLFMLLVIPFVALLVFGVSSVATKTGDHDQAIRALNNARLANDAAALDKALGEEAIAMALYIDGASQPGAQVSRWVDTLDARVETNRALTQYSQRLAQPLEVGEYDQQLKTVHDTVEVALLYRDDAREKTISPLQAVDRYAHVRDLLQVAVHDQVSTGTAAQSNDSIVQLLSKAEARSAHLDERISLQLALRHEVWAPGQRSVMIEAITKQNQGLANFEEESASTRQLVALRQKVSATERIPNISERQWFELSDRWLNSLDEAIDSDTALIVESFESQEQAANRSRLLMGAGLISALVLSILVTGLVALRLIGRVRAVTDQAKRLADGEAQARSEISSRSNDEISQLSRAFNETASRIENSRQLTSQVQILELIAKGAPLKDSLTAISRLFSSDETAKPRYRFTTEKPQNSSLEPIVQQDPSVGPLWLVPISNNIELKPQGPIVNLATGLAAMAHRQATSREVLTNQALRDALTGLLNRRAVLAHVEQMVDESSVTLQGGLLFVDLDGFKEVNDRYGHAHGDAVLREHGKRLQGLAEEVDGFAGRLGGDEFLLMASSLANQGAVLELGQAIVDSLSRPVNFEGKQVEVGVSVGCALAAKSYSVSSLLREADAALYRAKQAGRGKVLAAGKDLREQIRLDEELKASFGAAIRRKEFVLWYQPIWEGEKEQLHAFEALLRWEHPEHGIVNPAVFLPLAEEIERMAELDNYVLDMAATNIASWLSRGFNVPPVHVNLSASGLEQPDFVDNVLTTLATHQVPHELIVLEVTESRLLADLDSAGHELRALRDAGIRIATDDFGQGYSSLAYLQHLPVDVLKIDRALISGVDESEINRAIVVAVMSLAKALSAEVVAEGVETQTELDELLAMGLQQTQGFLLDRPMPLAETEVLLGETCPRIAESEQWFVADLETLPEKLLPNELLPNELLPKELLPDTAPTTLADLAPTQRGNNG